VIENLITGLIDLEMLINSFNTTIEMNLLEIGRCFYSIGYKFDKKKEPLP
jgi:hypothetical protein